MTERSTLRSRFYAWRARRWAEKVRSGKWTTNDVRSRLGLPPASIENLYYQMGVITESERDEWDNMKPRMES